MQKVLLVTLALSYLALAVNGQSCGIEGTTETTLHLEALTESTPGDTLIARFQLFGVNSTSAVSSPHYKYIRALRYLNGVYELITETIFPEFIRTERSPVVERSVNLRCDDGTSRRFTFVIPVTDEPSPPEFNAVDAVNVTLPLMETTFVVSTGIVVSDNDLEFVNADVYITSSNRRLAPIVTRLWSGEYPAVYSYQVDFQVDSDMPEGEHHTIVTADDGTFPVSKIITVTVFPSGSPATEGTVAPTTTTTEGTPEPEPTMEAFIN